MSKELQNCVEAKRLYVLVLDINYKDKNFVLKKLRIDVHFRLENNFVYYIVNDKDKLCIFKTFEEEIFG